MTKTHKAAKRPPVLKGAVIAAGAASLGVALIAGGISVRSAKSQQPQEEPSPEGDTGFLGFMMDDDSLSDDLWMQ